MLYYSDSCYYNDIPEATNFIKRKDLLSSGGSNLQPDGLIGLASGEGGRWPWWEQMLEEEMTSGAREERERLSSKSSSYNNPLMKAAF